MNQAGALQHCCGSRSFRVDRKIGQQPALGIGKDARDQVKARQRHHRIAQAAEAMDQNSAD
jgi:hypothetical protein